MKRNKIIVILFMTIILLSGVFQIKADMGPKPTSEIEIIGMQGVYYFDLLVEKNEVYVTVLTETEIQDQIEHEYYNDEYPSVLNGYIDEDGFASYTLYTDIPHSISQDTDNPDLFHIGYFVAPSVFKIALVTESGDLIVSDVIYKQNFNAFFTYDLSNDVINETANVQIFAGVGDVTEDIPYTAMLIQTLLCVAGTLAIEIGLLFAFGYRTKDSYKKVIIVNLITQSILAFMVAYGYVFWANIFGALGVLFVGEIIVFTFEIIIYRKILLEKTKTKAILYAFVANFVSLLAGFFSIGLLAYLIG